MQEDLKRCQWVSSDPLYQKYHDEQWGRPVTDPQELFAKLCLDGQQAGLSWITILKKQHNYYEAFHGFDPVKIAAMTKQDMEERLQNPCIIRNRQKVKSIVNNARAYLALTETVSFTDFLWEFTGHKTIINRFTEDSGLPAVSPESEAMSKALKKAGFSFVGPTICYAFMQAVGMVNDHLTSCHCYQACCEAARS